MAKSLEAMSPADGLVAHDCAALHCDNPKGYGGGWLDAGRTAANPWTQSWHREWMTPDGHVTVGYNADGTIDEILTDGTVAVHIEQMADNLYWSRIGGLRVEWHAESKKRLSIDVEWEGDE